MYKLKTILSALIFIVSLSAFKTATTKFVSQKTHLNFYSHTSIEDITADNYKAVSTLDSSTGEVVFSVPMQSFEFKKSLMQKHFNSPKFLDTKQYPKAKFVGKIVDNKAVKYTKDGTYNVQIKGEMTIKGTTKPITEKGSITVKNHIVSVSSEFNLTLSDYGIKFDSGKPSTNIAKTVKVKVEAEYKSE